jgi:PiT family inorganic phosphate transporter
MDSPYIFAGLCLMLVCAFEFINGFHDTANAVAPVIYSKSLEPRKAVVLAAFFNFLGVILGGT